MENYVEVSYSSKEKPVTEYPTQLATYLFQRFKLKKGMRLLDNGCGRGDFLNAFEELGLDTYGTDVSSVCAKSVIVDLEKDRIPFEDEFFDVVFSKSVIEHIKDCDHYINEMKRVLKRDGILIIMVPDWKSQYKIFYEDPTHVHPYCVESVRKLIKMNNMDGDAEIFYQLPAIWKHPWIKKLDVFRSGVNRVYKNKTWRFFREKMVLGYGSKK